MNKTTIISLCIAGLVGIYFLTHPTIKIEIEGVELKDLVEVSLSDGSKVYVGVKNNQPLIEAFDAETRDASGETR